jgi:NAD(P)-dependent dehydrogenase (short-subunit alcohol dehydrogenase family)
MSTNQEEGSMADPRVSVITGGAGGIGKASARRLAARGPLLLADVSEAALRATAAELGAEGADVHTALCDVTDPASVAALADRAAALGPLGAVVHTAGLAPPTATDPRRTFEVNLPGTARVLDAFLPHATTGTVAVCIASLAGYRAFSAQYDELLADPLAPDLYDRLEAAGATRDDVLASYSVSKHGVILEVRRRAAAWGRAGARIVSISPGLVIDTSIGEGAASIHAGAYAEIAAVGRPGYAKDVAGVVAFLASDDAAYVTGCDLLVDGGVVAHTLHHAEPAAREAWNTASYAATAD